MKNAARILIIDDEKDMLNGCCKLLKVFGHTPLSSANGTSAISLLQQDEFDLILCDLLMPEIDGMQILKLVNEIAPYTPVVIFTAYATVDRAVMAMKLGAFDFVEKPFKSEYLKVVIEKGLLQRKLYSERTNLLNQLHYKFSFDNIIGKSASMQKVFEMIESVAQTDVNVLITGESGTGKELIARSIHARSQRKTETFIPINCSAFPENLFEAELFGYEKGAFTGANQRKLGLLEFANMGTVFLDEVSEMPISLQVKLLRVLQDQLLRRLGSNELTQINIRLISASNRDLDEARRVGLLRDDLYYRLNVVNIHIPPLRDRQDDILLLAEYFLRLQLKTASSKTINGFHPQVLQQLTDYNWPGNVRELENVIESAVTLTKGNIITINDLPAHFKQIKSEYNEQSFTSMSLVEAKKRVNDDVERNYLFALLKECHGNVTKIAEKAKMTRRNLYRLINRHGLSPADWR